jgi:hypothetical protein
LEYKDTIINTFQHVGLSLNPNGSQDERLKIRDLLDIIVGDYHRGDVVNQQEENEEAIALAEIDATYAEAEEKAAHKRDLAEGDLSDEENRGLP